VEIRSTCGGESKKKITIHAMVGSARLSPARGTDSRKREQNARHPVSQGVFRAWSLATAPAYRNSRPSSRGPKEIAAAKGENVPSDMVAASSVEVGQHKAKVEEKIAL